jgi:hypothetical protein
VGDLTGKHGLIVGVANKRSISWAIAQAAQASGARLALTYPSQRLEENVRDLAETLDNPFVLPCDVTSDEQVAALRLGRSGIRRPRPWSTAWRLRQAARRTAVRADLARGFPDCAGCRRVFAGG